MAFMNQEKKKELAPGIKAVLKKYGMKGSISVDNYSTLVVTLTEGPITFKSDQVNTYFIAQHYADSPIARRFLLELHAVMNNSNYDKIAEFFTNNPDATQFVATEGDGGLVNFDHSDAMTDYFYVGWYTDINVGKWNKPYKVVGA